MWLINWSLSVKLACSLLSTYCFLIGCFICVSGFPSFLQLLHLLLSLIDRQPSARWAVVCSLCRGPKIVLSWHAAFYDSFALVSQICVRRMPGCCNACVECKQQSDLARAGWQISPGQLWSAGRYPVRCLFAKVLSGMARCSRTKAYSLHHAAWPTTGGWMAWLHAFTRNL